MIQIQCEDGGVVQAECVLRSCRVFNAFLSLLMSIDFSVQLTRSLLRRHVPLPRRLPLAGTGGTVCVSLRLVICVAPPVICMLQPRQSQGPLQHAC